MENIEPWLIGIIIFGVFVLVVLIMFVFIVAFKQPSNNPNVIVI